MTYFTEFILSDLWLVSYRIMLTNSVILSAKVNRNCVFPLALKCLKYKFNEFTEMYVPEIDINHSERKKCLKYKLRYLQTLLKFP